MTAFKIAAVTENGETLSAHFGRADRYRVFTIEDGRVVAEQILPKPHHAAHAPGENHSHGEHHHEDMFAPIADCKVLLCGGMGEPAYRRALQAGLEVMLSGGSIDDALQAYLRGELTSDMRRVHRH